MSGRKKLPVIYWDSCIFITWLTNEVREDPADLDGARDHVERLERGELRIATSTITLAEVLNLGLSADQESSFKSLWTRDDYQLEDVTSRVALRAREIRRAYSGLPDGLGTVSTPDAIHLASATLAHCSEFYTFDGDGPKRRKASGDPPSRPLIPLSGKLAGRWELKICKPFVQQARLPVAPMQLPDDRDSGTTSE